MRRRDDETLVRLIVLYNVTGELLLNRLFASPAPLEDFKAVREQVLRRTRETSSAFGAKPGAIDTVLRDASQWLDALRDELVAAIDQRTPK